MNAMLTDVELERLLGEAASSFAVPEPELDVPSAPRWRLSGWWGAAVAGVVVLAVGTALAVSASGGRATSGAGRPAASTAGGALSLSPGSPQSGPVAALPVPPGTSVTSGTQRVPAVGTGAEDTARIVRTGTIQLAVDKGNVSAAVNALDELVGSVHGYAADSSSTEVGDAPSAELTYRVPVTSFQDVIQRVRALKVQVLSVAETGKDVTATYADTQAQIQSLQAARERYLVILSRARTIGETLTVQQRVDDVQGQIDRLEGQRRVLADQSDYATLTVDVAEKGAAARPLVTPAPGGWHKAWHDATRGFVSGVQAIVGASGRTLLVLLCLAALLLLGRAAWRLARRRLV